MHYSGDATTVAPSSLARTAVVRLALIVSLLCPWGMANYLNDILTTQSKRAFEHSDFHAGLMRRAFYLFSCSPFPAGMFKRRQGNRAAVILDPSLSTASKHMKCICSLSQFRDAQEGDVADR